MKKAFKKVLFNVCVLSAIMVFANLTYKKELYAELPPVLKDISYGTNIDSIDVQEPMTVDIYFPAGAATGKKYPFVMMIHGGGFISGNKANMAKACQRFADSGFVAATLNYRMGFNVRDPFNINVGQFNTQAAAAYRALQDANAAMRFIVSKAKEYAIDTSKIFTGGGSAGAITALSLAYVDDAYAGKNDADFVKNLGGLHNADNSLTNTYTVKGICSMWGALQDSNLITKQRAIPAVFFHGTADKVVPVDAGAGISKAYRMFGSLCLYRQLNKYHVPSQVHLSVGGKHGPDEYKDINFTITNSICFFKTVMNRGYASGIYYGLEDGCNKQQ